MFTIRPTTQSDVVSIFAIVADGGVFTAEEADAVRDLLDYFFRKPMQDEYLWLSAEDDGRVVGFACYGRIALTAQNFELNWIATDPHARRHGVGSTLLQAVEDLAREHDGRFLNLETSATEPYAAAR
ncbi:MAG: GNAT family N-acetyltransferase, partial [Chloroflexota bacterium]